MKASLLEHLACPECSGDLDLSTDIHIDDGTTEIESGSINCKACSLSFPIERGIPRFVRSEWSGNTDMQTGERFGDSWKRYSRLHEKYTKQFFDWMAPAHADFARGKVILDAGCGKGRHTAVLAGAGAKAVIGVDIGSAIDVAYLNTGHMPNVHIIQADLKRLPLKQCFDWIVSTGVIHHMEQPELGFAALKSKVKPTGALSVWVYGRENNDWIIHFVNPIRKAITSRLPGPLLHVISLAAAVLVFLVARLIVYPWACLKQRFHWLPSMFYQDYLAYIADFDLQEIDHIVFDHLTAPVAHYLERETVESWYREQAFPQALIRWHNRNSWSAFGSFDKQAYDEVISHWQKTNPEQPTTLQAMRLISEAAS
jgi:SAM-dependent methyltransferase